MQQAWLLLALLAAHAHASKVLIMGDSVADWAGTSLSEFCAGTRVVQKSVAGSRAWQWAVEGGGTAEGVGCSDYKDKPCKAKDAFDSEDLASTVTGPITHVWFQVGAVDWLANAHCYKMLRKEVFSEMVTNVSRAITNIADARPNVPIIMLGYSPPTMVPDECIVPNGKVGANGKEGIEPMGFEMMLATHAAMDSAIKSACDGHPSHRCTFIDTWNELSGGATTRLPACKYHRDGLHNNNRGYCKMFTHPQVQTAFGCGLPAGLKMPDCESVEKTVPEAPRLYTGDAEKHEGWCSDYKPYYDAVDYVAPSAPPSAAAVQGLPGLQSALKSLLPGRRE